METYKMTDKEIAQRRKRNIAIGVSLAVLSMLFMITTMVRVGQNMGVL